MAKFRFALQRVLDRRLDEEEAKRRTHAALEAMRERAQLDEFASDLARRAREEAAQASVANAGAMNARQGTGGGGHR